MKDLNKIIDYVGNIKNMEIEDEGMYTPIESYVELRKDEVKESVSDREIINKNFPENSKNGVKVPPIK
jgi:aspartyl/glutamyl-tRNA(Asn/Gln) amidotransferase C subunit